MFLLILIPYHAQTNDQFERTNQTVEIAIRYLITINIDIIEFFFSLQAQFNNYLNAFIDLFFNNIIYNFKVRETLFLNLSNVSSVANNILNLKMKNRQKTIDAILFANVHMKFRYNARHKSLFFRLDQIFFLRLHKSYEMNEQHRKLDNQRCNLFLIKRRVDRFAYELNISFK